MHHSIAIYQLLGNEQHKDVLEDTYDISKHPEFYGSLLNGQVDREWYLDPKYSHCLVYLVNNGSDVASNDKLTLIGSVILTQKEEVAECHIAIFRPYAKRKHTISIASAMLDIFKEHKIKTLFAAIADTNRVSRLYVKALGFTTEFSSVRDGIGKTYYTLEVEKLRSNLNAIRHKDI